MPKPANLIAIPHCQHIKDNGVRCGSPALRGRTLCYFHDNQHKTHPYRRPYRTAQFCRRADFFNVRTPDDVMRALNQVMNAILNRQLYPREAGAIIFALQTANVFAPHTTAARAVAHSNLVCTTAAVNPADHQITQSPHVPILRPQTVDEVFAMVPGCEDLKAMLTPEDIAYLNSCATQAGQGQK